MRKSPLPKVLLAIVTVLALYTLKLCFTYQSRTLTFRELQSQVSQATMQQQVLSMLVNDAVEYSKTHPAIEPILQSVGIGKVPAATQSVPATTPKPVTK